MTDAVRPSGGARSELRRTIWPWSTEIPLLSADPFNLDARLVIDNEEYVRCTGRDGYTLTGCERGISPEEGGSEPKLWRGGTPVDQISWTTTEVVTEYPDAPTLAMVGRDFAWDAGDGNIYRYHVVLIEDAPVVIWDDEPPPAATDLAFLWAQKIAGHTAISGVSLDASGNSYIPALSGGVQYLFKYNSAMIQLWAQTVSARHVTTDGTTVFASASTGTSVHKRAASTGLGGAPSTFGTAGSGNGELNNALGVVYDGTNIWVVDSGNTRVQKFGVTGAYVSQFGGLTAPTGIALGPTSTHLYILNAGAGEIRKHLKSDHSLVATFTLGNGTADGQISTTAEGIAVDSTGRIWIADTGNHRIQVFDSAGVFLGKAGSFGSGDGQFKSPKQIAAGSGDIIYVADSGNNRLVTVQEDLGIVYSVGAYVAFLDRIDDTSPSVWSNMLLASTEFMGATRNRRLVDLTNATQYLLSVETETVGHTTAVLDLEYSTNLTTPSWTSFAGTKPSIAATGWTHSGWTAIPAGANAIVILRIVGSGGNATADPKFFNVAAQFR